METEQSQIKKIESPKEGARKVAGIITPRDIKACLWICEQGCMTVDQIWRAVWWSDASRGPRYAYERVLFLERAGYLVRVTSNHSLKSYFRATRIGQELASTSEEAQGMVPLASPAINEIPHAHALTELRLSVLKFKRCASWKSDRVLVSDPSFPRERFYGIIPDAVWTTPSGKRIAVEFERTRKGIFRVRQKVEALSREMVRADRVIDRVLWVSVPGAYQDLEQVLKTHPGQMLRTMEQFALELKNSSVSASLDIGVSHSEDQI
jgi:hypothetical protein